MMQRHIDKVREELKAAKLEVIASKGNFYPVREFKKLEKELIKHEHATHQMLLDALKELQNATQIDPFNLRSAAAQGEAIRAIEAAEWMEVSE